MPAKQTPLDQTRFSLEEPIFENEVVIQDETPQKIDEQDAKRKKKVVILATIGGFVLLFIALIVVLLVMRGRNGVVEETTPETVIPIEQDTDPLEQRIDAARSLLREADPTRQDLSFPPVDLDIRLDPKED